MTIAESYRTHGTGTNGFVVRTTAGVIIVATMLGAVTTSNPNNSPLVTDRTSSRPSNEIIPSAAEEPVPSTARGILAIRQMTNLTWAETARVFGVSIRTVHLWANGRQPSADQERKLNRVFGILRPYQNLGSSQLREKLMGSAEPGKLFFDLLCNNEFEFFQRSFAGADVKRQYVRPTVSFDTTGQILPSPLLLLDALQDRPVMAGKSLAKKVVRLKRQVS